MAVYVRKNMGIDYEQADRHIGSRPETDDSDSSDGLSALLESVKVAKVDTYAMHKSPVMNRCFLLLTPMFHV